MTKSEARRLLDEVKALSHLSITLKTMVARTPIAGPQRQDFLNRISLMDRSVQKLIDLATGQ